MSKTLTLLCVVHKLREDQHEMINLNVMKPKCQLRQFGTGVKVHLTSAKMALAGLGLGDSQNYLSIGAIRPQKGQKPQQLKGLRDAIPMLSPLVAVTPTASHPWVCLFQIHISAREGVLFLLGFFLHR